MQIISVCFDRNAWSCMRNIHSNKPQHKAYITYKSSRRSYRWLDDCLTTPKCKHQPIVLWIRAHSQSIFFTSREDGLCQWEKTLRMRCLLPLVILIWRYGVDDVKVSWTLVKCFTGSTIPIYVENAFWGVIQAYAGRYDQYKYMRNRQWYGWLKTEYRFEMALAWTKLEKSDQTFNLSQPYSIV